jgi:hypothetical protein
MLSRPNRAYLRASGRISRLAMAKVERSNPFIRFAGKPGAASTSRYGAAQGSPPSSAGRVSTQVIASYGRTIIGLR